MEKLIKNISTKNLPDSEVLAYNDKGEFLIGYLEKNEKISTPTIVCRDMYNSENSIVNVTKYIPIKELKKIFKKHLKND